MIGLKGVTSTRMTINTFCFITVSSGHDKEVNGFFK